MKNNPWFKDIFKDAFIGGLAGIGVNSTFMIGYNGFQLRVEYIIINILFGFTVGFFITLGSELVIGIFTSRFPNSKSIPLIAIQLTVTFIIGSGTYLGFYLCYWVLIIGQKTPPLMPILFISLGMGIVSIMIAIFFIFKKNNEELLRLEKENRQLAVLEERNRIARELHDSVSQNLFGISLNLDTLGYQLEQDLTESRKTVHQLQEMVQEIQSEMRLMIYELRPSSLVANSFFEAIESLVNLFRARYHLDIHCQLMGKEENLDSKIQIALYRVLQEALNNTVKHAGTGKIRVVVKIGNPKTEMTIEDDGRGFDPVELNTLGHIGISGMRERVRELGGEFQIHSQPGNGTSIKVQV